MVNITENRDPTAGDVVALPPVWRNLSNANKIYRFRRTVDGSDISQIAAGPVFGAYNFSLSLVDVPTEFSALFDQYRISFVKITFRPRFNMAAIGSAAVNRYGLLYTCLDYDDSTNLTSVADIRQYQTLKETRFDMDHVRFLKPHSAVSSYNGAFGSFDNVVDQWHDLASTTIQHYGVKFVIESGIGGQTALQTWAVELDFYLEFKTVR